MDQIKFRAVIPERNATIFFTLESLLKATFSNREILWEWLKAGNQPNQYIGLQTSDGADVYETDVIQTEEIRWLVEEIGALERDENNNGMCASPFGNGTNYFIDEGILKGKIIGNIINDPNLIEEE